MLECSLVVSKLTKQFINVGSSGCRAPEHAGEDMLAEMVGIGWKRDTSALNHVQVGWHRKALITGLTSQHLVEHNSQCPDVTFLRIDVLFVSLRSHIFGRAYVIVGLRFIRDILHQAIPKVNYHCVLVAL